MSSSVFSIIMNVFQPINIFISMAGTLAGIIIGALPGFSAAMGIAVLMPLTFGMYPETGLILMGSLFIGAMYGGSISAILINTPGTPSAAATTLDGYPLAKKGRAADALREAVFASFIGGMIANMILLFLSPLLAKVSLLFGPPEYFLLAVFGLTIIASISEEALIKGLIAGVIGLLISTIGMDPLLGRDRFTFGIINLVDGIQLVPALIGLFSIPEVLNIAQSYFMEEEVVELSKFGKVKIGFPSIKHIKSHLSVYVRSTIIGTGVGILPGAGGSIATFMAYNEAKRSSKHPELFGTGITEGIAATESANNSMAMGALIPMLTLGIPGDSVAAIIMSGLMVHGLQPGAELFGRNANVAYTFIISLFLAHFMMLLFGIYLAPYFTLATKTPKHILACMVVVLTVTGSYSLRQNIFDVYVMIVFGLLGYFMKNFGFSTVPTVLGIILGCMAEKGINATLAISGNKNVILFVISRPISIILIVFIISSLYVPISRHRKRKRMEFVNIE